MICSHNCKGCPLQTVYLLEHEFKPCHSWCWRNFRWLQNSTTLEAHVKISIICRKTSLPGSLLQNQRVKWCKIGLRSLYDSYRPLHLYIHVHFPFSFQPLDFFVASLVFRKGTFHVVHFYVFAFKGQNIKFYMDMLLTCIGCCNASLGCVIRSVCKYIVQYVDSYHTWNLLYLYPSVNYLSLGAYWPVRYSIAGLIEGLKT